MGHQFKILPCFLFYVAAGRPPNILHILADDFGWAQVGYHQPPGSRDVQTPNLDALRSSGLTLDRFYTHAYCSPSRCALQTGRAPVHVNVQNVIPEVFNANDLQGGYQGAPPNMTGVAELMKRGGYDTFAVGKWDVRLRFRAP